LKGKKLRGFGGEGGSVVAGKANSHAGQITQFEDGTDETWAGGKKLGYARRGGHTERKVMAQRKGEGNSGFKNHAGQEGKRKSRKILGIKGEECLGSGRLTPEESCLRCTNAEGKEAVKRALRRKSKGEKLCLCRNYFARVQRGDGGGIQRKGITGAFYV